MMRFVNVSIVLPAMDETYSLAETVDTIISTCKTEDVCEIIIVLCERSSKECLLTAQALVEKYSSFLPIFIHFQKKPFVGGAVQEGFNIAKGSHSVLMSSDLETDPDIVKRFIELAKVNPEKIITASRWRKGGGFEGYNKIKLLSNLIFQRLIAILFWVNLSDITYAFRIFPSDLVKNIAWEELKHPFFLETALKPIRLGTEFIEIPARWVARSEGVSQNSFMANFNYFKTAWHVRFMRKEDILKTASGLS